MKKRFHIGYYLNADRKMISGQTVVAEDIFNAMSEFLTVKQIDAGLIKYVVEMDDLGQEFPEIQA